MCVCKCSTLFSIIRDRRGATMRFCRFFVLKHNPFREGSSSRTGLFLQIYVYNFIRGFLVNKSDLFLCSSQFFYASGKMKGASGYPFTGFMVKVFRFQVNISGLFFHSIMVSNGTMRYFLALCLVRLRTSKINGTLQVLHDQDGKIIFRLFIRQLRNYFKSTSSRANFRIFNNRAKVSFAGVVNASNVRFNRFVGNFSCLGHIRAILSIHL